MSVKEKDIKSLAKQEVCDETGISQEFVIGQKNDEYVDKCIAITSRLTHRDCIRDAKDLVREIKKKQRHFEDEQFFCNNHNYEIQAQICRMKVDLLFETACMIENRLGLGYVSLED